jgi:hypothetical protein
MSDQAKRDPVLSDTRTNLEKLVQQANRVEHELDTINKMLDSDIHCKEVALVPGETPEPKDTPRPNLRFDMYRLSNEAIEKFEKAITGLMSIQNKLYIPEKRRASGRKGA